MSVIVCGGNGELNKSKISSIFSQQFSQQKRLIHSHSLLTEDDDAHEDYFYPCPPQSCRDSLSNLVPICTIPSRNEISSTSSSRDLAWSKILLKLNF